MIQRTRVAHVWLHPINRQDDLPLRLQAGLQALWLVEMSGDQFLVAINQVIQGALGQLNATPEDPVLDLRDAAVLPVAQQSHQADDVQTKLPMR